jgi:photosystem II stability/assembly factor-like uncharacterized protein
MTDDDLRDSFGDELTEALRIRSRLRASSEVPVAALSHLPRRRTHRRLLSATLAVAIGASVVGVIAFRRPGTTGLRPATSPSSTPRPTAIAPSVEASAGVADWTWVSALQGWALVRKRCGASVCMALHATSNGGRTWTTVRIPEVLDTFAQHTVGVACATHLCVSGVRFATTQIGWLFGPTLLQTTDGGRRWSRLPGPPVMDVEASQGVAVRLVSTEGDACGGRCTYHIQREPLAAGTWQPVSTSVFGTPSLIILGSDVYLASVPNLAGTGHADLRRSTDAGKTWIDMIDPCTVGTGDHVTTSASAAPDGVFVVLCSAGQQPRSPFVRISTDGGMTFGPRRPASAQTLAVGYSTANANGVLISDDGGETWRAAFHPPLTASDLVTLGWEDSTTARVSFNTDTIWTTRDAGVDWTGNRVTP